MESDWGGAGSEDEGDDEGGDDVGSEGEGDGEDDGGTESDCDVVDGGSEPGDEESGVGLDGGGVVGEEGGGVSEEVGGDGSKMAPPRAGRNGGQRRVTKDDGFTHKVRRRPENVDEGRQQVGGAYHPTSSCGRQTS